MKGIENEYPLVEPTEENAFELSAPERNARGIASLPGSLKEAIEAFAGSDFGRQALGDHVFESLIQNKTIEWDAYRKHVSDFELDRYLAVL